MKKLIFLLSLLFPYALWAQLPSLQTKANKALEITQMHIDITVIGNIATTNFDLIFYNPNTEILEGEFSLDLAEGQEVFRYALDVNGKLREGVVVEKVKARQAFEAVVRQNIDPGIINKTKGNKFKTSIYPIPAKGSKRVVIAITETLQKKGDKLYYTLPTNIHQKIKDFALNVKILKGKQQSELTQGTFENITFDNREDAHLLSFQRKEYKPTTPIHFEIPLFQERGYQVFTENREGQTYFYLNYKTQKIETKLKKIPSNITLYWDCSFSASSRDFAKEFKLLESYLTNGKRQTVKVIPFNHTTTITKEFYITSDISPLINYLKNLPNDGATRISNLKFDQKADAILLFTDGVNTLGEINLPQSKVPIYTIASSLGSDYNWLRAIAVKSSGTFINLNSITHEKALHLLNNYQQILPSLLYNKSDFKEIYSSEGEVVGILQKNNAKLQVDYNQNISGSHSSQNINSQYFQINTEAEAPVSRIWAKRKIQHLLLDYENNKEEILALSKKYSILTQNTAMLVLDRVQDYVSYKINPPEELQKEYDRLIAEQKKQDKENKKSIHEENLRRIKTLKTWYTNPPTIKSLDSTSSTIRLRGTTAISAENEALEEVLLMTRAQETRQDNVSLSKDKKESSISPATKVLAWLPDAPYMKEIDKSTDFERTYFKLKKKNKYRPAFYIQISNWLFAKGKKQEAVRVLSNILELDLENPELLKVAASRLLQEKELDLALMIFEEIKELRPEEPQSYRDLALAYEAKGDYQKALIQHLYILQNTWGRFEEIKDITFNEMNRLVALHKKSLNTSKIPDAYIFEMPLDVRITIDWSSNDNDIDLWVIDPNGEKCYYQYKNTKIGGKISKDFTGGYGPEEFCLKTAKRGTYTAFANYYSEGRQRITGPVTITAKLYTNYGRKNEIITPISIQIEEKKETTQLGQILFDDAE